jgi:ribonuclease P/MRP protein subunit RPP1
MAIEAGELGFDSIVAMETPGQMLGGIRVLSGAIIRELQVKGVIAAVRAKERCTDVILVNAGDNSFNRAVLNLRGVHVLRHIHKTHRGSFDHVTARIAADRQIALDIDIYPLIHLSGVHRQRALRWYEDLVRLREHYAFPLTISSNARSVLDQRSPRDLINLCGLFGMSPDDVESALSPFDRIISPERSVETVP